MLKWDHVEENNFIRGPAVLASGPTSFGIYDLTLDTTYQERHTWTFRKGAEREVEGGDRNVISDVEGDSEFVDYSLLFETYLFLLPDCFSDTRVKCCQKKSVWSTETCILDFEIRRSQVKLELSVERRYRDWGKQKPGCSILTSIWEVWKEFE